MRNCPFEAEIDSRSHQHQIVRPRRNRGYERKYGQCGEDFCCHHLHYLADLLPNVLALLRILPQFLQLMSDIDSINANILHELTRDGRISNIDLADKVGLSPSACLRRVQELERKGVILGYRAVINPLALGNNFVAYVLVGLSKHTKADQAGFEAAMAKAREVRECHNITGTVEYLLRVEAHNLAAYKYFHTEVLGTVAQVASIVSYIVMGSPKDERA